MAVERRADGTVEIAAGQAAQQAHFPVIDNGRPVVLAPFPEIEAFEQNITMRLLVTGGCGFVGSNFVRYVLQHYGPEMVTNVDALTTGRLANLEGVAASYGDRYEFLHADIADGDRIEAVVAQHQYFAVVHFAAESSDAASTVSLMDRARRHGVRRFLLVSKDRENSTLAAEEEAALTAQREHHQEVVITRATDNYGPFQPPAGLVAGMIVHALRDQAVPIPDDGSQVRDWLHVEDHCAGLFAALLDGRPGAVCRLASGHECQDQDLAHRILEHLGRSRDSIEWLRGQPEPDRRRSIGVADGREPLAWKPRHALDQGLRETIDWYVRNRAWWEPLLPR